MTKLAPRVTVSKCSVKSAFCHIPFLILSLCILPLLQLTNASLSSCRCVHFNSSGVFHSPNFPNSPVPSLSALSGSQLPHYSHPCLLYKFVAPDGYIVEVTFNYFQLSPRTDRLYDATTDGLINEKTVYNDEFCAKEIQTGQTFYSYTKYLIFLLKLSSSSKGFHGTYNLIPRAYFLSNATEVQPCRFRVDTLNGSIFSPNYPYFYPSNSNCTYYFAPRRGYALQISLLYLHLRRSACHQDYIDIFQMRPKVSSFHEKLYFLQVTLQMIFHVLAFSSPRLLRIYISWLK
ncbi:unnamed protein product [Gongylonema pulchrum]|uniref:CUB domain-containing protein n=1 Tax=Gongylonema pulchrum TaxID=637853 RepID=A0A183D2B2_9BILA|nr:unnamed protein product [Gongylonema pulchrum]